MSKKGFIELNVKRKTVSIHLCGDTFDFHRIRPLLDDADFCNFEQAKALGKEYYVVFNAQGMISGYPKNDAAIVALGYTRTVCGGAVIVKKGRSHVMYSGIDLNTCHKIKKLFDLREEIVNGEKT